MDTLYRVKTILLGIFLCVFFLDDLSAIVLPNEFEDVLVLEKLLDPASMAFSPDGRLFFGERISGRLRVAKYQAGNDTWTVEGDPFYTFDVPAQRHRSAGLRGFAFDPDFAQNGYIYVFYMKDNPRHNRVVRIQTDPANPDQALPNSETLLMELPFNNSISSGSHNGGDICFGADGMLYFTTGDGWNGGDDVQSLSTYTGKVFRIRPDGTIPADNPFFHVAQGDFRAIYALGLRNPYTMAVHPGTGDIYINEARGANKADVYRLLANGNSAGANFGHDGYNGIGTNTDTWTNVATAGGKLVTGGAWYPNDGYWPEAYLGNYLAALWGGNGSNTDGRISRVLSDGNNPEVQTFATQVYHSPGRHKPVMCKIGPDQNLYYLLTDYETGDALIRMVRYTGVSTAAAPQLSPPPGQYDDPQQVEIISPTAGTTVFYTTDGSTPTANSPVYQAPVQVDQTTIIQAMAIAPGLAPSPVNGGQYLIGRVPNLSPVADAGPDLMVAVRSKVTLNGAASYDPDGSPLELVEEWLQTGGPPVVIADADETVANFTPTELGTYTFQLTVTDVQGDSDADEVVVTVVEEIPDILDGLVARWRMETGSGTTLEDFSGNANTARLVGPAWSEESPDSSAFSLKFDGADDRVDAGKLDLVGSAMSICFWFRADDFGTHDARFISKASGQGPQEHFWMVSTLNQTRLRFRLRAGGTTTTLSTSNGLLSSGQWMHVAAVYDGSQMLLYLDGKEVAVTAKTGGINSDPAVSVALGNQPVDATGGPRPFDGLLDEMRIYGKALTADEVAIVKNAKEVVAPTQEFPPTGSIRLFPQPMEDVLRLQCPSPLEHSHNWSLLDVQGNLLRSGVLETGESSLEIPVGNLAAGIYVFTLKDLGAWQLIKRSANR